MEKEQKKSIGCRVNKETYKRVERLASREKWSLAKVAETAVEFYLKARKG